VLSGGGSVPAANAPPEAWVEMVNGMQGGALSTRLGIPVLYGIDAVHGHGNAYKATIFPHNVGLGCTRSTMHYHSLSYFLLFLFFRRAHFFPRKCRRAALFIKIEDSGSELHSTSRHRALAHFFSSKGTLKLMS